MWQSDGTSNDNTVPCLTPVTCTDTVYLTQSRVCANNLDSTQYSFFKQSYDFWYKPGSADGRKGRDNGIKSILHAATLKLLNG